MRTVKFDVCGLNQLKILNSLALDDIAVTDFNRCDCKHMSFRVAASKAKKTAELLDRYGMSYSVTRFEPKKFMRMCLKRIGLPLGVVVMIIIGVIASMRLWKIEISGNERVDDLTIVRALGSSGIKIGSKTSFDTKEVVRVLMDMSEIAAASARLVGTTLKVEVIESTPLTPTAPLGDVVSLYDALVTKIVVTSGSSLVKIGDKVSVGKTLIEGVEYDTEGNPLLNVKAEGKVYGKVNFTFSELMPITGTRRTGRKVEKTDIILFGKRIGKEANIDFMHEVQRTTTRIGSFLPLYAEKVSYYELENYTMSLDELIKSAEDKAVDTLIIKAGTGEVDVTSNCKLVADGLYRVNVHIEAEISIGGKTG